MCLGAAEITFEDISDNKPGNKPKSSFQHCQVSYFIFYNYQVIIIIIII